MTTKARTNTAPWLVEIFNGRTPKPEEVVWMVKHLLAIQEIEDEYTLRLFQTEIAKTLGSPLQ